MKKLPNRRQFNTDTRHLLDEFLKYYENADRDFGTRGEFENRYKELVKKEFSAPESFVEVTVSGTAALFVILQALKFSPGEEVLCPPITDPGAVTPILMHHLRPRLYDLDQEGMVDLKLIQERVTSHTKALILNHYSGVALTQTERICQWCKEKGIVVIEDSSQAHGALLGTKYTGTFGDVSFFSTMFSKNHSTGGTGAVVLTPHQDLYENLVLAIHKGKAFFQPGFNEKDPAQFREISLNLELPEICSAIGLSTLSKLKDTNARRNHFLRSLNMHWSRSGSEWRVWNQDSHNAPYFGVLNIPARLVPHKPELVSRLQGAGIHINGHYPYLVSEWPWMSAHLEQFVPENAKAFRERTINLLFNEFYDESLALEMAQIFRELELNFH